MARDVEDYRLGAVLDPNGFTTADLDRALAELHQNEVQQSVHHWSAIVRSRGPAYAAREIQGL